MIETMIEKAKKLLKDVFGFEEFRLLQEQVIGNILSRRDSLVIMPTGGGKSLCYQLPALMFRGLTVVISPLISLMKDQVEQLRELNIPAVLLNSSLSYEEYYENVRLVRRGDAKLLYLAPETLLKQRTLEMLSSLPIPPDCITIDEAHCISEWGHDFRPEYRQIVDVRKQFPSAVCVALTATATPRVQQDILNTLGFESSNKFIASFNRENLFLKVIPKQGAVGQVLSFLQAHKDQPGIIYCFTRKQVDELTVRLGRDGFSVLPYHAGLPDEVRRRNQERFIRDDVQIIIATIAFGMGINKSNIRFVVHYDLPRNIESYYQEIGRAGRDGMRADCLLLFGYGDTGKIRYFIDQKEESERKIANMHLSAMLRYAETDVCRRIPMLTYFGEDYSQSDCGMCDNCTEQDRELQDLTIPAQKFLSCVRKTGQIFGAAHIIDVLRGSKAQKVLKFNHDQLSTYNIGTDLSKKQWLHLSRQFIQKGILYQDLEHGSLKVTPRGVSVLRSHEQFLGILQAEEQKAPSKRARMVMEKDQLEGPDYELFQLLRQKRKELADEQHVAPYMIFSDKTLAAMAISHPERKEQLLNIHGVGGAKLEKYGDIFFELIFKFRYPDGQADYRAVPEENAAPAQEEMKKKKFQLVGEAFNEGLSIGELEDEFGIKRETIIANLSKYIQAGNRLRSDGILNHSTLSPELQTQVMTAFVEHGTPTLAPVYNSLNGRVDYPDLRIMQLYILACNS